MEIYYRIMMQLSPVLWKFKLFPHFGRLDNFVFPRSCLIFPTKMAKCQIPLLETRTEVYRQISVALYLHDWKKQSKFGV